MGVPVPTRDREKAPLFASTSVSSSSSLRLFSGQLPAASAVPVPPIILDDDDLPRPAASILHSVLSSASTSSSMSSSSSASPAPMLHSKRPYIESLPPSFPSSQQKRMKQTDIRMHDTSQQQRNEAALNAQVDFFLYEGIALRIADSPWLRLWLDAYVRGLGEIADRKALAIRAHARASQVKQQVIAKLRVCRGVTVGVDGWTNVRHDKVINLCPVGRAVAYYWNSVVLKRGATAEEQAEPVAEGLRSIITASIPLAAIVTDNEAVNGAMYRLLEEEFPFLIHIPCAAHTLQLCVRKVLKLSPVAPCVRALRALLLAFKHNKELRILLKEQQGIMRKGKQPLQLITIVPTRWNSIQAAAMRVMELQHCLTPCVPSIIGQLAREKKRDVYRELTYSDDTFWEPLAVLIAFLGPYQIATDIVQSDDATLGDVHHQFAGLTFKADQLASPHLLAPVKGLVKSIIQDYWLKHVNINAVIQCSQFSFDPAYTSFPERERLDADDWFSRWGTSFIKHYSLSVHDDERTIAQSLEQQRCQFLARSGIFHSLEQRRAIVGDVKGKARLVWSGYLSTVPEMAGCVLALLELTASEAAVERSFSRQGILHSKARNRLTDNSVHAHMSFAFNTRALAISEGRPLPRRAAKEKEVREAVGLLDDEDISRGTALLTQYLADDEVAAADSEEDASDEDSEADEGPAAEVKDENEADEQREEEEEEEEKEAISTERRIQAVVVKFCEKARVTQGFRWNEHREGLLHALIVEAEIDVHLLDMQARVKQYVASPLL